MVISYFSFFCQLLFHGLCFVSYIELSFVICRNSLDTTDINPFIVYYTNNKHFLLE